MVVHNVLLIANNIGEVMLYDKEGVLLYTVDGPLQILQQPYLIKCCTSWDKGFLVAGENAQIFQFKIIIGADENFKSECIN